MASPAMDMGVLSIMGLGEGRGVNLCFCFLRSASFSCSHCSAILPQSMAAWLFVLQGHGDNGDNVRCDRKTSLPSLPPHRGSNPIMLLPQNQEKQWSRAWIRAPRATHFGCCLCLELDDGCDWEDWGVVLAWSWYWGVVMGWLGVV